MPYRENKQAISGAIPVRLTNRQLLVIGVVLVLAGSVLLLKKSYRETGLASAGFPNAALPPEMQLEQLMASDQPLIVFFHSTTCEQCIQMMEIVAEVYPQYADQVALVDVNVYDARNEALVYRSGIRMIPTLIFINRAREVDGHVGVLSAQELRDVLQSLAME